MAANTAQDKIVATPRPPGSHWVAERMIATTRAAMEPRVMILPATMNMEMASSTSRLTEVHISSIK